MRSPGFEEEDRSNFLRDLSPILLLEVSLNPMQLPLGVAHPTFSSRIFRQTPVAPPLPESRNVARSLNLQLLLRKSPLIFLPIYMPTDRLPPPRLLRSLERRFWLP